MRFRGFWKVQPSQNNRIVFVIGSARTGGAEGQMVRLACELHARGRDVLLLFLVHGGELTDRLDAAGVPWKVARRDDWPPSSTGRNLFGLLRLALLIRSARPAVVCGWLAGAVWPALIAADLLTRAVRVAGFRGEVFERDLRWQGPLFRRAVSRAHLVTVNSPSLRLEAERWGASPSRIEFLPNGVDIPPLAASVTMTPPTAVVVANFRWYKGHDLLLEALRHAETPGLVVRLCGEGEVSAELRSAAQEADHAEVVFVPDPADIRKELETAQFAIHPSRTEGLSNAILEELAAGLPVVATDVGGTSLLIETDVNGLLVPPADRDALRAAIERLSRDSQLRQALSLGARSKSTEFSWEACAHAYMRAFDLLKDPQV